MGTIFVSLGSHLWTFLGASALDVLAFEVSTFEMEGWAVTSEPGTLS